jgi:activator of HSP90 ATPase
MEYKPVGSDLHFHRRRRLLQASLAVSGLTLARTLQAAASDEGISRNAEAIHQEISFNAAPSRIYAVLTDAALFQHMQSISVAKAGFDVIAHPARISREPGGEFSLFADYIVGRQIELVSDRRLVQAWRVANWTPGRYSIAHFELMAQGTGTRLVFDHMGFPAGDAEHLAQGWYAHYWEPLRKELG